MYLITTMPMATASSGNRIAPPAVPVLGSNPALGTPAFGHVGIDARVRDAKQAAPPRGELR
jgi:hypothetical protein